ncbi:hypothetical protein RF11_09740 [Thelohanellus kitauei]|uniref:Uncharacterized protein n=1 Tax=Thelohanellus kitauei TaxID=669202 RepID=A0A0C2MIM2_THEKT|nr:hypothetical protein RF11_09740 [Thelohanellus kitauei]
MPSLQPCHPPQPTIQFPSCQSSSNDTPLNMLADTAVMHMIFSDEKLDQKYAMPQTLDILLNRIRKIVDDAIELSRHGLIKDHENIVIKQILDVFKICMDSIGYR